MRICWLLLGFVCGSIPTLNTHPVSSLLGSGPDAATPETYPPGWLKYVCGTFTVVVVAFAIIGCMCCKRHRHPKGFQEFKDAHTSSGCDLAFENPVSGLELEVPQASSRQERICFEPLPLDCLPPQANNYSISKPKLPHSIPLTLDHNRSVPIDSYNEWFDFSSHIPREKLKYLREIGHGWFGKVVEGRADLEATDSPTSVAQNKGVIVRILTEEATNQEKSWFLREATPYLKLHHRNILSLLGSCLETDPYLLLFEACPHGDLKGFLLSNSDCETRAALSRGNIPKNMAIDIAAGLEHMHAHGLSHTDLAARNCLVASDLSIKLGDYGTTIEKYPFDYYVVGDRALPIRWAAPESLKCTDTTIETLEITVKANLWSYAVLLWEIVTWGKRPYDSLCDEEVIQAVLSSTDSENQSVSQTNCSELLLKCPEDCPQNLYHVMRSCWATDPSVRPGLDQVRRVLEARDFELRWETLRPNTLKAQGKSASLFNLHGSIDSDGWISPHLPDSLELTNNNEKVFPTSFRLGPEEPVKNVPGIRPSNTMPESDSETEEESWLDRVKRGAYTEKVRQKSKSVADLMILVHIDSDSDADWSIGIPVPETTKKRLTSAGSDSNLKTTVLADEFTEALKKLRNPPQSQVYNHSSCDDSAIYKNIIGCDNSETTNVLTLTSDVEKRPMLRLSPPVIQLHAQSKKDNPLCEMSHGVNDYSNVSLSEDIHRSNETSKKLATPLETSDVFKFPQTQSLDLDNQEVVHTEEHILRLVPKSTPCPPLLRLIPDINNAPERSEIVPFSTEQKLTDVSEITCDLPMDGKNECVRDNIQEETQRISNNCDKVFEFHLNDNEKSTEVEEWCNIDSENSAINYVNKVDKIETDPSLLKDLSKSGSFHTLEPHPAETNINGKDASNSETKLKNTIGLDELENRSFGEISTPQRKHHEKENASESLEEKLSKPDADQDEMPKSNALFNEATPRLLVTIASEQSTPSPTVCRTENTVDHFLYEKEIELEIGEKVEEPDITECGDDAKRFSTPDDERSSDSGFRDKESCEEEESPAASTHPLHLSLVAAEEEHLHVISELDAVLDAESPGNFMDDMEELLSPDCIERIVTDLDDPKSDDFTESTGPGSLGEGEGWFLHPREKKAQEILRSNSDTNADVEDNINTLSSDVERLRSQNRNAMQVETDDLEFPVSPDILQITVPSEHIAVADNHSGSMNKSEEVSHIALDELEYPANKEGNGSTESLHSDNSYISFGLDEEYVVAIRKELSEKLPHAQMPVEEVPEPCDVQDLVGEDELNIMDHRPWIEEEAQVEQGSGVIDISIRYNVYNTPLSPILEERETFGIMTSESLGSKDSHDESLASQQFESPNDDANEDLLLVDVATNRAILLDGDRDAFPETDKEDQDTLNIDMSDDENFEYQIVMPDSMQEPTKQVRVGMGGSAPLPSPEDELKWQQLSLSFPLPRQDDLMSTSFTTKHDWDSQDEDNSSSSGEFIWKDGERMSPRCARSEEIDQFHNNLGMDGIKEEVEADDTNSGDADEDGEGDEEDVEFTPSAWDSTLAPHRSALRSPDKTQRADQKKSVWFKKQRYHCVYEYPKEASTGNNPEQPTSNWEPTSYADWEELMDEPRLDLYPLEYEEADENGEEFYVSSSNRPFQFQTGDGEQVSQFFPGATTSLLQQQHQQQLGELRHTRDRLKLNLPLTESQTAATPTTSSVDECEGRLAGELDLKELGACEAEISSEKKENEDVTISQEKQDENRDMSPALLSSDNRPVV